MMVVIGGVIGNVELRYQEIYTEKWLGKKWYWSIGMEMQ